MKNQSKKFLEFNGKNIYFLSIDGTYWVAIKPICEALEVDYIQQFKNLKSDEMLGDVLCNHTMVDKGGKLREMVSLPEKFIYGWIFSIQSASPELIKYKKACYEVLFEHFHGAVLNRPNILKEKVKTKLKIKDLKSKLYLTNSDYKKLIELEESHKKACVSLSIMDRKIVSSQMDIWKDEIKNEE